MKLIIAATDFSPAATHAVNYAADMASALDAELLLFNCYNIPVNYSDGVLFQPIEELEASSEAGLNKLKQDVLKRTGGKIEVSTCSRMGDVTEELNDAVARKNPFAVVIGTRGKTNFEKTIFGSSTLSIIRELEVPVICIPPGVVYGKGVQKVALACDFKNVADSVPAKEIMDFLRDLKPELHILNVDYMDKKFRSTTPEDSFTLHQLFYDSKPAYHYIDDPDVESGINDFVQLYGMDMLITIPKKHGLLEKIFKRSHTREIIRELVIPVVCIHNE